MRLAIIAATAMEQANSACFPIGKRIHGLSSTLMTHPTIEKHFLASLFAPDQLCILLSEIWSETVPGGVGDSQLAPAPAAGCAQNGRLRM